jgi:two-component system, OmpR family, phosphate regulon sensor histidine kinase PhoR
MSSGVTRGRPSILAVLPHQVPTPEVYRDLVDAAPDAMLAIDTATGVVRLANARVERLFGHRPEDVVDRPVGTLLPEGPAAVRRGRHDAACGTAAESSCELVARHLDGHAFPVEVWLTPLPACGLVALAIRDVSEHRAIRAESERVREEIIATVSHELRTPLTSILGYTEVLVDMGVEALGEQGARLLEVVKRNAERELRLVEDMLALAAIGTSGFVARPAPVELALVARSVLDRLADTARHAGVELADGSLAPVHVAGSTRRLEHMVTNLVGNAIKFTERGSRVELRLREEDDHALLEVEDQGRGVEPDQVSLVFDRHYRTPDAVAAHVPGAGFGLPVVRGIVDAHQGRIELSSRPGLGTTVQVRLPVVATASISREGQNSRASASSRPRRAS